MRREKRKVQFSLVLHIDVKMENQNLVILPIPPPILVIQCISIYTYLLLYIYIKRNDSDLFCILEQFFTSSESSKLSQSSNQMLQNPNTESFPWASNNGFTTKELETEQAINISTQFKQFFSKRTGGSSTPFLLSLYRPFFLITHFISIR